MKKKNGFLAVSIIFSFFVVFLMLIAINLTSYAQNRILLNQIKKDIKSEAELKFDKIEIAKTCDPSTEECPICVKATELHVDPSDSTKTYGRLYEYGTGLEPGYAFDCDVNGDGIYSSNTERFYYISDLYTHTDDSTDYYNESIAVLIYYKNVATSIKYNPDNLVSHGGAIGIRDSLPNDWNNITLYSNPRNLTDKDGTIQYSDFYYNSGSRILTYQELFKNCSIFENISFNNCNFLLENKENYWLETIDKISNDSSSDYGYYVNTRATNPYVGTTGYYASYGVRPVIEVPIADIEV